MRPYLLNFQSIYRLPSSTQKHYEVDWVTEESYQGEPTTVLDTIGRVAAVSIDPNKLTNAGKKKLGL